MLTTRAQTMKEKISSTSSPNQQNSAFREHDASQSANHSEFEAQQFKHENYLLRKMFEIMPSGILLLDNSGRIAYANPMAIDLLSQPLVGQLWMEIIERSFAPQSDDGHEISLKDGRKVNIATRSLVPLPGQLIILNDLTATRSLQAQLNQQQRLAEMGQMTAHLAHQIRTPISSALLYAENIAKQELSTDKRLQFSQKIVNCLQNLEKHVRDMLLFAKGDEHIIDKVANKNIVTAVKKIVEPQFKQLGGKFILSDKTNDIDFYCNRTAIEGAIINLIDNSLKACGDSAVVELTVLVQDENIIYSVKDNGPGISDELINKIFEPFYTTSVKGTGLGLAVVNAVASAHSGKVTIDSAVGKGTEISLIIPILTKLNAEGNDHYGK